MAYYWYESDPQLYQMEVAAMQKFFPSFEINQLQDGSGRLYWRGKVQPTGEGGMVTRQTSPASSAGAKSRLGSAAAFAPRRARHRSRRKSS